MLLLNLLVGDFPWATEWPGQRSGGPTPRPRPIGPRVEAHGSRAGLLDEALASTDSN